MQQTDPEPAQPVVQLLRHALELSLAAKYGPDGQITIVNGLTPKAAINMAEEITDEFCEVEAEADEGQVFEDAFRRLEYCAKWSVADDYPAHGFQNFRLWAWEFLRRNEQYALLAAWMNDLPEELRLREEAQADDLLAHVLCDPAPLPGQKTVGEYERDCHHKSIRFVVVMPVHVLRHCWSVNWPLPPGDEFPPEPQSQKPLPFFVADSPTIVTPDYVSHDTYPPIFPFQIVRQTLSSMEMLFKFNLGEPFDAQLERASARLDMLRTVYFRQSRLAEIPPGELDDQDSCEDLNSIPKTKNYVKALQLQLRILDAANTGNGYIGKELMKRLVTAFRDEMVDLDNSGVPTTISAKRINDWYRSAKKLVNWNYVALVSYKPLPASEKDKMRDRKKTAQAGALDVAQQVPTSNLFPKSMD